MNESYTGVDVGTPAPPPITQHPLWAAAPAGLEQYWGWNDPRWGAWGRTPESMKYPINDIWDKLLRQSGFSGDIYTSKEVEAGIGFDGQPYYGSITDYTPEAKAGIDRLRAAGYDVRQKHPDRRTFNTYYGLVTPSGEVQDIKIRGSDLGDAIMPMIKIFGAGLGLAGLGAGINSLLGGAGAGAGAGAGSALGIAEAMAPGVLAPATAAEMAGVNALLGGGTGALTAADLAALPADVMGQISPIPQVEIANFPSLGDTTVTNVVTPGTQAPGAASTNALAPGPYQNLTPTELLQLDYATTPGLNMSPMPSATGTMSQLQPFPASTAVTVEPPTFKFSPLQDLTSPFSGATGANVGAVAPSTSTIADLAGIPADAGFAAGMGVDAGMNALNLGAGLGAGAGAGGGGAATAPAATAAGATAAAPVAATAGAAGGGGDFLSGMSDVAATEGAGVAGTGILTKGTNIPSAVLGGGSILDKAIDLLKSPAGQAVIGGVGSVVGGITQANAAEAAANQQAEAAQNALQLQRDMFNYQKELLDPYRKRGEAALTRLSGALGLEGPAQPQQMLEMDPGYGFRLGEGMKALERMQAARGNMLSGGALKAGQQYAQNFASNEYDRAFGRLADIAGIGRSTAAQQGTAAQQFGTSAGNVMGQEANALAAGRYGRASAYTGALEGVLGAYENYLNRGQRNQLARDIYGRMLGGGG